jgi:uncharacterized membrane protein
MRVIGIEAKDFSAGEFVLESLDMAVKGKRVTLEDLVLVEMEAGGEVKIHQTKGLNLGRLRDRGVSDKLMKSVGETLEPGQTIVFALGSDEAIEAIDQRVKEISPEGDFPTFTVDPHSPDALAEARAQLARDDASGA